MRKAEITEGAAAYYAEGRGADWRYGSPTRAVVVTAEPHTIVRRRQGPFYLVSWHPDPAGNAVLVDLHESRGVRRTAVPARCLRGLWKPTLAALGRAEADVKAHDARISELAAKKGEISVADLVAVAAHDEAVNHHALAVLTDTIDPEGR
jgi:hypothetical protein